MQHGHRALTGGRVASLHGGDPVPLNPTDGDMIATGTVTDPSGAPVADAVVFLTLQPTQAEMREVDVGGSLPQTTLLAVTTSQDGSFGIRLGRDPRVIANATADGGFANFDLEAVEHWPADDIGRMGLWAFPLTVTDRGFVDLPGPITITLMGGR